MRDDVRTHPEILEVYPRGDQFFAAIGLTRKESERVFEIGLSRESYGALKRVLNSRPFNSMPGLVYQWFFVPSVAKRPDETAAVQFWIEQGRDGKAFWFDLPMDLAANLMWFDRMADFRPASHLRSWAKAESRAAAESTLPATEIRSAASGGSGNHLQCVIDLLGRVLPRR